MTAQLISTRRRSLDEHGLDAGKKARPHRILFQHGHRNGTALFLPYDQGMEHGPRDFFANPRSSEPGYIAGLARNGECNGVVLQIGLAEKFYGGSELLLWAEEIAQLLGKQLQHRAQVARYVPDERRRHGVRGLGDVRFRDACVAGEPLDELGAPVAQRYGG